MYILPKPALNMYKNWTYGITQIMSEFLLMFLRNAYPNLIIFILAANFVPHGQQQHHNNKEKLLEKYIVDFETTTIYPYIKNYV